MNKFDVVGIGANVFDTLMTVSDYPKEDTKTRAVSVMQSGGGPCATGLVAASRLGCKCSYLGNFTDDIAGIFLKEDMEKFGVSTEYANIKKGYQSFSSVIWLSESSASRTCVFDRGTVPPLELSEKEKDLIGNSEILMVDGNDIAAAIIGAEYARKNGTKVLYDAGGIYDGIEKLIGFADFLIPSAKFALKFSGCDKITDAAVFLFEKYSPEVVVITDGKNGGILYDGSKIKKYPAFEVEAKDTNGSGDVFHGAFAAAVCRGYDYEKCCVFASAVSAIKKGTDNSASNSAESSFSF